jgi:putative endonuclease
MRDHSYFTYIVTNRPNGTLYTGVTNNLVRRIAEHREGRAESFTRRYVLTKLVWYEHHADIREAILREKRIKKWNRAWKLDLIEAQNPAWEDLWLVLTSKGA